MSEQTVDQPLAGRCIAVPESRELNLFASMLEQRGAQVFRCPLVSIYDSPDTGAVESWLREFSDGEFDDLILLTGEGLRRLLGFAERAEGGLYSDFVAALGKVRKITRGPKPGNALRKIGLKPDLLGLEPTTSGVIAALASEQLEGRRIGVQLYGTNPNLPLVQFLEDKGATVSVVAPYIYADDSEENRVVELVDRICARDLDAVAFTSTPQVTRLLQVAKKAGKEGALIAGLNGIQVAAIGPVVADVLKEKGVEVKIMPEGTYFMKPLVRRLVEVFQP